MDRLKTHKKLTEDLHDLYVRKNADYGDSFRKVREDIPNAILVRLGDKMNRLKTLMTKPEDERKVVDESIDDTLMDIANYALLELVERYADSEVADCEACEEEEEEDEEEKFEPITTTMGEALKRIDNAIGNLKRNTWRNAITKHTEVYTHVDPETGKIVLFQCVVEDGKVVEWSNRTYDHDDEIEVEVGLDFNEEDDDEQHA